MADRIGRRKVFVATVLNFSLATGLMAASPDEYGWLILAFCRMLVGIGVAGMVTVDLPLVQEFVPSSKRGWVGGLVTTTVSVGGALGATAGAYLGLRAYLRRSSAGHGDRRRPAGQPPRRLATLEVLKEAGLITERRNGTQRLYAANPQALGELRARIEAMWHEALGGMAAAIDEEQEG